MVDDIVLATAVDSVQHVCGRQSVCHDWNANDRLYNVRMRGKIATHMVLQVTD